MNPPSTLLDATFLSAVADADDVNHDDATAIYRTLIEDFVDQRRLLFARADHLATVANGDLFAPVDKLHIARQHRNAANELIPRTGVDVDLALTLVLIRRSKIRDVATFDERLAHFDVVTLAPPTPVAATDNPAG